MEASKPSKVWAPERSARPVSATTERGCPSRSNVRMQCAARKAQPLHESRRWLRLGQPPPWWPGISFNADSLSVQNGVSSPPMSAGHGKKVFIQTENGAYLTGSGTQWEFTGERTRGTVFDYVEDRISEQLEAILRTHGIALVAVPVDPAEIHEACDDCACLVAPARAFYDGKKFLCDYCKDAVWPETGI